MHDLHSIASKLALTSEQSSLFIVLLKRSERIARMYLGAMSAFKDEGDPERLCKAAHEMRELMEKIPEIVDVEIRALKESMGSKVGELENAFNCMTERSNLKPPTWDGEVDEPTQAYLESSRGFFDWKVNHQPRRNEETARALRALDGPGKSLPPDLEKAAVRSWMEVKEFFVRVAHHGHQASESEFRERLAYVEEVLLNKLNPKTFADFDAADAIIREGEGQ
jgi:hypothetical protein